uniref:Uncharacterized protein n=1 Tax=Sphaerodactylus townsendi TaxID=933632 RepID=A0ACB8F8J8_9SAUR
MRALWHSHNTMRDPEAVPVPEVELKTVTCVPENQRDRDPYQQRSFAADRDVPQESTSFGPYEQLIQRKPSGQMDSLSET